MHMFTVTETKRLHLDSRTKLLPMAVVTTAEFLYGHAALILAAALIPFILLLTNRQYRVATIFIVLLVVALAIKEIQDSTRFHMVVNMAVVSLAGLVLRLFPAFVMGNYITKSTTANECATSPGRMHISRDVTTPPSILFRFLPTMQEESAIAKDVMRMREIQFGMKKFWRSLMVLLGYRFILPMISVVEIDDELSTVMLTRGLDSPTDWSGITRAGSTCYDAIAVVTSGVMLFVALFITKW